VIRQRVRTSLIVRAGRDLTPNGWRSGWAVAHRLAGLDQLDCLTRSSTPTLYPE
jgi:hypothetical protein